uniref:Ribosomal protein uL2 n=1 Tax=Myoviridae sp. ctuev19 TaxID=2827716 RepID=A0A8S5SEZ2_9CAUD|nr:MAG TPA: ribosomal protein uL2 [Myoviridae sp. ctuev19]
MPARFLNQSGQDLGQRVGQQLLLYHCPFCF